MWNQDGAQADGTVAFEVVSLTLRGIYVKEQHFSIFSLLFVFSRFVELLLLLSFNSDTKMGTV